MYLGTILRNKVPQGVFMKLIAVMLAIIGGRMLWQSLIAI